ncbi:hypothetical protein GLOIN_2v1784405 [Rhizophagus irregularis DAOM 181602=DAOM 197198]|uniref:F-box domain-containing protein n=2 Tax=Rhizophagus irregularis TaxID=588596 RepID=A0A2N1NV81_9GLOM|nr:hypothetical protein RirG_237840 [Rhizophagus irregularis DAOM 197198w]PKK77798.1 hypothetical protein RhiirC2_770901 [Rhizophagus irregularis]GBC33423.1 hypothetical protein GLOIN_2v1784405 [Rhizophagus irregularis DAOM 181602=DAOM 197198]CAB4387275.1 unnamed protein product [Rhizophagus irregularis]
MSKLSIDCLNEIFEYLEKETLHSCLLVNRLWCESSVRFFWRDGWNYNTLNYCTLISCLPEESKEILNKNEIIIPTPTSKPPIFNYATFCKVLSINQAHHMIKNLIKNSNQQNIFTRDLNNNTNIVMQEICKLFMRQITSLKKLIFWKSPSVNFNFYPGSKNCLKYLTELHCNSNIPTKFFYQLSQVCQNILSLDITIGQVISDGLKDFISVQKNLKYLDIHYGRGKDLRDIIPTYVTFSQLQILKIQYSCSKYDSLIKFLEMNGKSLKEFYIGDYAGDSDNSLNLAIANFCPNIRKLSTGFKNNELKTLKLVFNCCQFLESINIWCGGEFFSEKEALEAILYYSNKNTCELVLYHLYNTRSKLLPEELESILSIWKNRVPIKPLSLMIVKYDANSLDTNDINMKIIRKYIKLGVIKKFKVTGFDNGEKTAHYRKFRPIV